MRPAAAVPVLILATAVACAPPAPETTAVTEPAASRGSVRVGLERLGEAELTIATENGPAADGSALDHLAGKRLGLVVHAASVTADGRHAIDVLTGHGLDVTRLFSPEHGLRGRAAAGEKVESGHDPVTGLPVISLYGEVHKPRSEDLAGLDVLVFDLQGAGVRFYTYVSTLILVLEAAAENDLEVVVLDRPNPLGGRRVEGPLAAPRDVVPASFVNMAPGPLVHGLTMGEMAFTINAGRLDPTELGVVAMAGWSREMTWADTGRPWVSPSPNLRSAEASLAYPGVALLEATNVSEGRGTAEPFLVFGAPWLAGESLEIAVPGFELEPVRFTPRKSSSAPWVKHADVECAGWKVVVIDPSVAEPYRLGVELVTALSRLPDFEWRREGEALTWLLGTDRVFADLASGRSAAAIVAADHADHEAWRREVAGHLLYPGAASSVGDSSEG